MSDKSRREFLLKGTAGVAALSLVPTLASGQGTGDYGAYVTETPATRTGSG